jgi:hypothetical protein
MHIDGGRAGQDQHRPLQTIGKSVFTGGIDAARVLALASSVRKRLCSIGTSCVCPEPVLGCPLRPERSGCPRSAGRVWRQFCCCNTASGAKQPTEEACARGHRRRRQRALRTQRYTSKSPVSLSDCPNPVLANVCFPFANHFRTTYRSRPPIVLLAQPGSCTPQLPTPQLHAAHSRPRQRYRCPRERSIFARVGLVRSSSASAAATKTPQCWRLAHRAGERSPPPSLSA